jgi:hypothetical protein
MIVLRNFFQESAINNKLVMNPINQAILESVHSGDQTAGELNQ